MSCSEADNFKNLGNECVKQKDFEKAIEFYTKAIELAPDNYTYYSNRSAAYVSRGLYQEGLEDAQKTVELNPKWIKGYSRVGAALEYLGRRADAKTAYEKGLEIEPGNAQLTAALAALNRHEDDRSAPNFMDSLLNNPEFRKMASDPEFLKKMAAFKNDPTAMFRDPKLMEFMSGLSGATNNIPKGSEGKSENIFGSGPRDYPKSDPSASDDTRRLPKTSDCCRGDPKTTEDFRQHPNTSEDTRGVPTGSDSLRRPSPTASDTSRQDPAARQAEEAKNKGNQAYKSKNFSEALTHYKNAKTLNPNTIIYDLNISAVLFEQGKYDECITLCEEAVERGRQLGEPFKLIARALARIGNSYHKQEKFDMAIKYFNKSLSEFRDPEINKKLRETEKMLQEQKDKEYINPEIAEKERELGNGAFSKGDYVQAVKHYSEAIKRLPTEAKTYSNRAAAYTKLMEYHLCIQDCNKAIELDPKFVKSYLRKANALLAIRDPTQAKAIYEKVISIDFNNKEAYDGLSKCSEALSKMKPEEASQSALRDPEVQEILGDPSMRMVLEQMQNDPASAQSYLRDPVIMRKIEKLVSAGVIKIGHK